MHVVYRGATLIDGTGGPARPGTTIVVDGERIVDVAPDGAAGDVDLAGRFVIPGLIDSHQHIATPPDRPAAEAVLRRQLMGGVTAIRSMADDLRQVGDLARATLIGEIPGPDIHYAALMAGPSFFDDPRTWQVSQGETPGAVPWMQAVTDEIDLPLAVAMARGTHATAIKIYANLPGELVAAITAEAHRQGIAVWAHATVFPATPSEVVEAGVDTVSHVTLLAHDVAPRPLTSYQDKPPVDHDRLGDLDTLFARMREHGTVLDATASLWTWMGREEDADLAADLTRRAFEAGVPISTGTDYETEPESSHPSLHEEMAFLVERCGMPADEVIRSATQIGARSIGLEETMGTVEAGKLANFVVLRDDPLRDIANLRGVGLVVKRGRRYPEGADK